MLYGMISLPLAASLLSQLSSSLLTLINILSLPRQEEGQSMDTNTKFSSSFLLMIFVIFLLGGALLFSLLFQWTPTTSLYFVFTTLSTIGFGDVLPGDSLTFLLCGGYIVMGK